MAQHYSNPKRESDPYALPDVETFFQETCMVRGIECRTEDDDDALCEHAGWYWQACFPGCLPDGEPYGPFATEAEALEDAREGMEE